MSTTVTITYDVGSTVYVITNYPDPNANTNTGALFVPSPLTQPIVRKGVVKEVVVVQLPAPSGGGNVLNTYYHVLLSNDSRNTLIPDPTLVFGVLDDALTAYEALIV